MSAKAGTTASRVTVTSAATSVVAVGDGGRRAIVRNRGTVAVYLGGAAVTSATGWQLDPGESFPFDLDADDEMYGITASSSAAVHVLVMDGR